MASVFTQMIEGTLPARFVYKDDRCVALLSSNPLKPGHTLVVPRDEVARWTDLDLGTWEHVNRVTKAIGVALERAYKPAQVALMIAGLDVAHMHVHVVPIDDVGDLDLTNAELDPDAAALDQEAEAVRTALADLGATPAGGA